MAKPLNVGLVGGGKGAFIVHAHQKAIHFDGTRRVVAGALYPEPKIALEEAAAWPYPIKGYGSYDEMIAANASLPAGRAAGLHPDRHAEPRALRPGDEGDEGRHPGVLREAAVPDPEGGRPRSSGTSRKLGIPFGVAHTYLGHWTSRFSRYIVQRGLLGDVRWVDSSYIQGWLATKLEATGQQQATLARRPEAGRRVGLRRRHRHARADAAALRHRPRRDARLGAAGDVRRGAPARRSLHRLLQALERRQGARARVADLHRLQERPGHRWSPARRARSAGGRRSRRASPSTCRTSPIASTGAAPSRRATASCRRTCRPTCMAEPTIPSGHGEGFHDAFARLHRGFERDVRAWKAGKPFTSDGSQVRERRGRLDGHRLPRDLRQEQQEEGRLDRDAEGGPRRSLGVAVRPREATAVPRPARRAASDSRRAARRVSLIACGRSGRS